jgi:starvation-inducible DNA-binding protein
MGTYAPASLQRFSMLTQVDDETEILDSKQMVIELLNDNEKMVKLLKMVFELSEQNRESGFSDFIAGRIDAHQKHGWMLRATLK